MVIYPLPSPCFVSAFETVETTDVKAQLLGTLPGALLTHHCLAGSHAYPDSWSLSGTPLTLVAAACLSVSSVMQLETKQSSVILASRKGTGVRLN